MTQHSAEHRKAPHNTTATQRHIPQGGTQQKPALHNNITQHATPQPNGSYKTPHKTQRNTAQHSQPPKTTQNTAWHSQRPAQQDTTQHHTTTRHNTRCDTTQRQNHATPHDQTPSNAAQHDDAATQRHITNRKQRAATHHDLTLPPCAAAPPHGCCGATIKSAICAVHYSGQTESRRRRSKGQEVCNLPVPYMVHTHVTTRSSIV